MMRRCSWLFPGLLILVLGACSEPERALQAKFFAFGTEIDVSLYGTDLETAQQTVAVLEAAFDQVDETWHAWRPSTLMTINQAIAAGESITISASVASLIAQAAEYAARSDDLFNPAAGQLFALWGYHGDDWSVSRPPPDSAAIAAIVLQAPRMADLTIEDQVLSSRNPAVKLGFGGFAKGHAVNLAIEALQDLGIENAMVNIGGDLRAIGSHGKRPWVVGIRHPQHSGILASTAVLHNESVFTSGDYERYFTYEGERYPHILDPRTGYPAREVRSSTVIDEDASLADAAATALFVAGEEWPTIAAQLGVDRVMIMMADGRIELTPRMAARVRLTDSTAVPIVRE